MTHAKPIDTANAAAISPVCPARESAVELIAAIKAYETIPDKQPVNGPDNERFESHLTDLVDAIRTAAEWTRPTSAEGALLHLCLGFAAAYDMPEAASATIQAQMERKMFRHLHAVRAYLIESAGELTDGWEEIFEFAMPSADDYAPQVTERAVSKRPRHRLAT